MSKYTVLFISPIVVAMFFICSVNVAIATGGTKIYVKNTGKNTLYLRSGVDEYPELEVHTDFDDEESFDFKSKIFLTKKDLAILPEEERLFATIPSRYVNFLFSAVNLSASHRKVGSTLNLQTMCKITYVKSFNVQNKITLEICQQAGTIHLKWQKINGNSIVKVFRKVAYLSNTSKVEAQDE
jgi:hypothetical protein